MATARPTHASIDAYIAAQRADVQGLLQQVRDIVSRAAPSAEEVISYGMPAVRQHGVLVYFAAFKHHIGLYPPVTGDAALVKAAARYAGDKGNLRFPLDQPIPFDLIERIVRWRVTQDAEKAAAKATPKRKPTGGHDATPDAR